MIKVNLVPAEILAKARQRQLMLQAGFLGGALGIVLVVISLVHWAGLYRLQNEYKYKDSKLHELSAIVAKVEELEKAADAVKARLGVIESLLKGRAFYPLFMSEFARTVPGGVKVVNMTTQVQGNGALKLTISAVGNSNDDVAAWMRTLEKDAHFAAVELGPVTAAANQYNFTITTTYTLKL
jgi:Tfp pilus assembly protein PilN